MDWITANDAREVAEAARELHERDIPSLGRRVGFLEPTGLQMLALDVLESGPPTYQFMHSILPMVVVDQDRVPIFPGSEVVAALPGMVIEQLMGAWLECCGLGGPTPAASMTETMPAENETSTPAERGIEARNRLQAMMPPELFKQNGG